MSKPKEIRTKARQAATALINGNIAVAREHAKKERILDLYGVLRYRGHSIERAHFGARFLKLGVDLQAYYDSK